MKTVIFSLILSLGILNASSVDFAKSEADIKTCYLGGGFYILRCINGVLYSWWEGAVTIIVNQDGKPVKCSCEKRSNPSLLTYPRE